MRSFRFDNGHEFNFANFIEFCNKKGIRRELMQAYSLQQNGVTKH
jgi:hypothetical protein